MDNQSQQIIVTGLVQGVGFRPFVFRMAKLFELTGWVQNTNENVKIQVTGTPQNLQLFLHSLKEDAPVAAMIEAITAVEMATQPFTEFQILVSHDVSEEIT